MEDQTMVGMPEKDLIKTFKRTSMSQTIQRVTGNEPYHPTGKSAIDDSITIYQEAVLRFMVQMQPQYGPNADSCAEEANIYTKAYIKSLNNG